MTQPNLIAALLCLAVPLAACGVDEAEAEPPVASSKSALLPFCLQSATATSAALFESVELGFAGARTDVSSVDRPLSPPNSLYNRTSITTTVNAGENWAELFALPFSGFAAGGANLVLEVQAGGRVLCSQRQTIFSSSTPAGKVLGSGGQGDHLLTCGFDATGLTSTPIAHVTLEVWGTAAGIASSYTHASATLTNVAESRCIGLHFVL